MKGFGIVLGASLFVTAIASAACGRVEPSTDTATQAQAIDTGGDDADVVASGDGAPGSAHPPCPGMGGPPGALCGSCTSHEVCCSAPEPCAGHCVPDCRVDPTKCPTGLTCDAASGVCKGAPGSGPPPPPPPPGAPPPGAPPPPS